MKSPIIVILFLIASSLKAQTTFPLDTLEKICGYNFANYETYMLRYDYAKISNLSDDTTTLFQSEKVNIDGLRNQCSISRIASLIGANSVVNFSTTDKSYYLTLQKRMQETGFKLIRTEPVKIDNVGTVLDYYYSNSKFTSILCTYSVPGKSDMINWYNVQVRRN